MLLLLSAVLASVHPIHPGLSARNADVVRPVMDRARQELEAVAAKSPQHRLVTTSGYGSWFLPVVTIGGDLDFLGVVDIGELPPKGAGEAAATRIEAWLSALSSRRGRADPTLALLEVEGLEEVAVTQRARTIELVDQAAAGVPHNVAYPLGDAQAPYSFPAGVVSIPFHPRGKYLSNAFALDPAVAAHVREVSIQFFFVAQVAGRPLVLQPLYGRAAAPIEMWRFVLEASFASKADRAAFATVAKPGFDEATRRAEYAAFMLMVADIEIAGGRSTKVAKRLSQALLAVAPAAPRPLLDRSEKTLVTLLGEATAAWDDLAAVAGIHAKASKAKALAPFVASGDTKRLAEGYLARLGDRPEATPARALLRQAVAGKDVWVALKEAAKVASKATAPKMDTLQALVTELRTHLRDAGVHMVPVTTLDGQRVVVSRSGLAALGLQADALPPWPVAPWTLDVRADERRPARRLFVRHGRAAAWKKMRAALDATPLRW